MRNDRWGKGRRWQARWGDASGKERVAACDTEDEARQVLRQMERNPLVGQEAPPVRFADHATRWRAEQLHHRPATRAGTGSVLNNRLLPVFGEVLLADITRRMVQEAVVGWSRQLAPATVRGTYDYLHSIMDLAVADGLLPSSPCTRIKLPPKPGPGVFIPTTEQVVALRDAMTPASTSMVVVAAASGLRPGELRGLTVGAAGRVLRVYQQITPTGEVGPPKTNAGNRQVDIGARAWRVLEPELEGRAPEEYVWPGRGGDGLSRSTLADRWRRAARGMGLPRGSGWHTLRHYHASLLIAAGLSPTAVAGRLGHANASETLSTYSHLWPSDEARCVAAIEAELPW